MIYCDECGEKLKERAKFCADCGTPTSEQDVKKTTSPDKKNKTRSSRWIYFSSLIAGILLALASFCVFFNMTMFMLWKLIAITMLISGIFLTSYFLLRKHEKMGIVVSILFVISGFVGLDNSTLSEVLSFLGAITLIGCSLYQLWKKEEKMNFLNRFRHT